MNEALQMKWDATNMILLMPIFMIGFFAVASFFLFVPATWELPDCSSYEQDWKVQTCNEVKTTAIKIPLMLASFCCGIIGVREILKRTWYKELFK